MRKRIVPAGAVPLDDVFRLFPTVRQSLLALFDDCALAAFFELEYARGWSTHPQARGTLFHRFAAEVLRTMREQKMTTISVTEARVILLEVCEQKHLEPRDIVRVPLRMMPELRMAADKFARDNTFSVHKIVDIEQRMSAMISYVTEHGEKVERALTGQLDALLFDPPDGAIVLDWKDTWALPPEPKDEPAGEHADEELKGLSYQGYFQQRFYGWLVMRNYSNVDRVTLREFYVRKTKVRRATLHRHQLADVEDELRVLVEAFDRAVAQGSPMATLKGEEDGYVDIDALDAWKPSPGRHCGFCVRAAWCPIEEDARVSAGAAATSEESARKWAARLQVAERIKKQAIEACKGWVETSGAPIPVKWSKGRSVLGWVSTKGGRRFKLHTPSESDRGGATEAELDRALMAAMKESTLRARAARDDRPREEVMV